MAYRAEIVLVFLLLGLVSVGCWFAPRAKKCGLPVILAWRLASVLVLSIAASLAVGFLLHGRALESALIFASAATGALLGAKHWPQYIARRRRIKRLAGAPD